MTSFLAIDNYSPLIVLFIGIFTFIGLLGAGMKILEFFKLDLPSPWRQVVGVLLGIQIISLAIQLSAMMSLASRPLLIGTWLVIIGFGVIYFFASVLPLNPPTAKIPRFSQFLAPIISFSALLINLLVAIAPSTKIDELYYHMLLPSRIVMESTLNFYREPYNGSIFPHMIFQISTAPLHALGFPDAGNVVSWCLSLTLFWFAWYLATERSETSGWGFLWAVPIVSGLYPIVWHTTSGAHAMGDLATAAAVVALLNHSALIKQIKAVGFASLCSILVLASVSSKISLLPLGITILIVVIMLIWRHLSSRKQIFYIALAICVPWLIFYLPILLWTLWVSGSPFGPVLAGVLSPSPYDVIALKEQIKINFLENRSLKDFVRNAVLGYSPLFLIGLVSLIKFSNEDTENDEKYQKPIAVLLFGFQSLIIFLFLPLDLRFYGGLIHGLAISFAIACPVKIRQLLTKDKVLILLTSIFVLPLFVIQVYYSLQFFPISLALEPKSEFYQRYIPLKDYSNLDRILPKDAVLLTPDQWISSVYFPRPIYLSSFDLPLGKNSFLFVYNYDDKKIKIPNGYRLGKKIYSNEYVGKKDL